MKKFYTLFLIALMGISSVLANSVKSPNNSASVANNTITMQGAHAVFYISGGSISYHEGTSDYFHSYSFGDITKKSSREYSITWQANSGLTIAVTDISFKMRAYNGSAGFDTGSAKVQFNGKTTSVGTIWVVELDEKSFFTIKGTGNFSSGVTFKCDNTSSIYKFEYLIKDIVITYTITPDKPGLKETTTSVQVTLDNADKQTVNLANYFTVTDETDFRPLVKYNTSGGTVEGNNFYSTTPGTFTVNAYIAAKDNCHEKSGNSNNLTINVTKAPALEVDVPLSMCDGGEVSFHGKTYSEAGTDVVEAEGAARDTIYNVTITAMSRSTSEEEMTMYVGEELEWNGIALKDSTVGTHTVVYETTNVAGCDSIVTLTLTVQERPTRYGNFEQTTCDEAVTFNDVTYHESFAGDVTLEEKNIFGGDSVVHVNIVINHASFGTDELTMYVGEEIEWNGIALKDSTVGEHTVIYETTNVVGCDSTVTLSLTVLERPTTYGEYEAKFCEGDSVEFAGKWYFEATQENVTLEEKNSFGGDSIIALTVTMLPVYAVVEKDTVEQDSIYEWQGEILTTSELGTFEYTKEYTTVEGCDSIITLYLTVEAKPIEPEDPTALEMVEAMQKAVKEFRNGVLYIRREGKEFTLDGRMVK